MSLTPSEFEESIFFNEPTTPAGGRDHLGIQATSVATYALLVPGLTNLTNTLRYYSFYPWLIQNYALKIANDSRKQFNRFMRRGELLYAFAVKLEEPNLGGIPGSNLVLRIVGELTKSRGTRIEIAKYADPDVKGSNRYWKYSSGAFGQYYVGPLTELRILQDAKKHNLPVVTKLGGLLADGFESAIGEKNSSVILQAIDEGSISLRALQSLSSILHPSSIRSSSKEMDMLFSVIVPEGNESLTSQQQFRRGTIREMLRIAQKRGISDEPREMPRILYLNNTFDRLYDDIQRGWYFYAVNELISFGLSSLMYHFLREVRRIGVSANKSEVLIQLRKCVTKDSMENLGFKGLEGNVNIESLISILRELKLKKLTVNCMDAAKSSEEDIAKSLTAALMLILMTLAKTYDEFEALNRFAIAQKPGIIKNESFLELHKGIRSQLHLDLLEYMDYLVEKRVIQTHLRVAYRKMGSTNRDTLKFLNDDGVITYIENVPPTWTSPRLGALISFLHDLKLLDAQGNLTKRGNETLINRV